jgi:hypothetical protein
MRRKPLSQILAVVLVVALFVTHFRILIAGHHFLPEHFVVIALLAALIYEGKTRQLLNVATDRTALLLGAYIVWEAFISIVQAPDRGDSLAIAGWLAFDWLMLVALVTCFTEPVRIERITITASNVLSAVAVVLGLAMLLLGSMVAVNTNFQGTDRAVYALSFEPNILASTVAIWTFVGVSSRNPRVRRLALLGLPLSLGAIAFSATRAVFVGAALGVLVWLAFTSRQMLRYVLRGLVAAALVAALVLVLVPRGADTVSDKAANLVNFGSGNGGHRVDAAKAAISDLDGPVVVVGLGLDSYGQHHFEPTLPGQHVPAYLGILPLQILYDGGIVAVALILAAVATLKPWSRPGRARALGVLVIFTTAATATSPFWFGSTWLLIALAMITRPGGVRGYLANFL